MSSIIIQNLHKTYQYEIVNSSHTVLFLY